MFLSSLFARNGPTNFQVLNWVFNAKVVHQLEIARSMCGMLCGLEHTVYFGDERHLDSLHRSLMLLTEAETVERLVARRSVCSVEDKGDGDQNVLQNAV